MATATRTRPNVLSYSAYALIGAADRALQETRSLAGRREELPDDLARQLEESVAQMRDSLDKVVDHLGSRVKQTTGDAGETLDDFAARGRAILDAEEVGGGVEDPDNDLLAPQGWQRADSKIDGLGSRNLHLDPTILGDPLLGDVEFRHNLEPGADPGRQ